MKKLFIAICSLTLAYGAHAQQAKPATTPAPAPQAKEVVKDENAPKFSFKEGDTYDFGEIPEGPVAEHTFTFKNTGKEPLIITEAHGSCGCTKPEWPKEPIKPKKKGDMIVRYNTQGRVGPFTKDVYITSNAVGEKGNMTILHIKGTVKAAPPAAPKAKS